MRNLSALPAITEREFEQATVDERRAAQRHITTLRVGRLVHFAGDELCLVRNISSGGAMVHVGNLYSVDDKVTLDLRLNEQLEASVVWVRDGMIGLRFERRIELVDLFVSQSDCGLKARAPRLSVPAQGRLQLGEDMFNVVIADISQGGAKIYMGKSAALGLTGRLWLDNFCSRACTVRWSVQNGAIGVAFAQGVAARELSDWVKEQRTIFRNLMCRSMSNQHTAF